MDKKVAQLNIEHYRKRLEEETDPAVRNQIQRLLGEEEQKLIAILARDREKQTGAR